jgi:hypothetical protein
MVIKMVIIGLFLTSLETNFKCFVTFLNKIHNDISGSKVIFHVIVTIAEV